MSYVSVALPRPVATPRAAPLAAALFVKLAGFVADFFAKSEAAAASKAIARQRAKEAGNLRRYARQLRSADPGFAADLLAAADRHNP